MGIAFSYMLSLTQLAITCTIHIVKKGFILTEQIHSILEITHLQVVHIATCISIFQPLTKKGFNDSNVRSRTLIFGCCCLNLMNNSTCRSYKTIISYIHTYNLLANIMSNHSYQLILISNYKYQLIVNSNYKYQLIISNTIDTS